MGRTRQYKSHSNSAYFRGINGCRQAKQTPDIIIFVFDSVTDKRDIVIPFRTNRI